MNYHEFRVSEAAAVELNELGCAPCYFLEDWYVDASSNRIQRGDTEVKLESKVMAVLDYLVQHRGELVTRDQLEQAIWGGTVVGYDSLTSSIAKLRKALCDDRRQPCYIETVSKKGYRLIGQISDVDSRPDSTKVRDAGTGARRNLVRTRFAWWISAGILALGIILAGAFKLSQIGENTVSDYRIGGRPSIAVLPFANLSNDPDQSYFSDGVTADITTALSKLSGMVVISHSLTLGDGDGQSEIKKLAGLLGARYILTGSIRRTGDRIRVNVHLTDSKSDIFLWSEKYDRELKDVFDVQDDITARIVSALSIKLTEEEKRRVAAIYTANIEAYDDFLRGQVHYPRRTQEDNRLARNFYQRAIDRDGAFSRAYGALALTLVTEHRYGWGGSSSGQLDKALLAAQKGVSLSGEIPQVHWVLSFVHLFRQEYSKAVEAANHTIELDPNFADSYVILAVTKIYSGELEDGVRLVRKAMLLNPEYPAAYSSVLGQAYYFMGNYERAERILRKAVDRNINLRGAHIFLIATLSKRDRMDEAEWATEEFKIVAPKFTIDSVAKLLPIKKESFIADIKKHLRRAGL